MHDHDPDWLNWRLERAAEEFKADLFVVDAIPELADPYGWFTKEAGEYPDDLTSAQVNAVLRMYPVLMSMALNEHSPQVIFELFPDARGAYVYIGEPREGGWTPSFSHLPT
jgi:hypothetical protein